MSGYLEDPALACSIDLIDASLEAVAGNLVRSRQLAEACFDRATRAGFAKYRIGSAANLALNSICRGDFGIAREFLGVVQGAGENLTYVEVAALDNAAQVELAEGNLSKCQRLLDQARQIAGIDRAPARSWNDLANDQTRCAYLERVEDWAGVIRIVDAADGELERRQFKAIRTTLLCAKARALGRLGRHDEAERLVTRAMGTCPRGAVDPLIVLEATRGACLSLRGDVRQGTLHLDRALASCRAIGHRYHELWIDHLQATLPGRRSGGPSADVTVPPASDVALLLSDVATILGAGHSVDLLAHRTAEILRRTPLGGRLDVGVESGRPYQPDPGATWTAEADGACTIRLSGSDRRVTLRIDGVHSLDDVTIVKSLADLARAAVSRTADVDADDDHQNLWPRGGADTDGETVFQSPRMLELLRVASRLADTNLPVLITGETGTGKEILARMIHDRSRVKRGPFVPFNCSAIPRELIESQLFGHRRGAFTGAMDSFPGVIRAAEQGTLFLDEVGDLDPAAQPKLLRFLEGGEIRPLGDTRAQHVPVRIVAATNANLEDLVAQGRFRNDLFYRIGVTRIELPPLRERKDEIPAFAALFLQRYSRECGRAGVRLGDDLIAALLLCDWPGNIRQLANEMRRVIALAADGQVLSAQDLAPDVASQWRARGPAARQDPRGPSVTIRLDQTMAAAIEELEQHFIEHALDLAGGRVADAASRLGLSRKGLFLKRRRRGLVRKPQSAG
ncbi:MAG: sigma-54 dependent transcriptional regulator [Vicinamibacterales bacterium]